MAEYGKLELPVRPPGKSLGYLTDLERDTMANETNSKKRMPRGAIPSPRSALAAAKPFMADLDAWIPPDYLMRPSQMSYWGNSVHADCVTAEEAFAKAAVQPEIFIPEDTLVDWAKQYGFLNMASIYDVMSKMNTTGITLNDATYKNGPLNSVNWTNAAILRSAIYNQGPVKLGVASGKFEDNDHGCVLPGTNGWAMYGYPPNLTEDHCVSLCGYGTFMNLYNMVESQYGALPPVPAGMPQGPCYAIFSWHSIGIVDEQSMLNMTYEAWVRSPVTIDHGFRPRVIPVEEK
jgi:hypothetical protein